MSSTAYQLGTDVRHENLADLAPGHSLYKWSQDNNRQVRKAKKAMDIRCPTFLAYLFNRGFADGYDQLPPKNYK